MGTEWCRVLCEWSSAELRGNQSTGSAELRGKKVVQSYVGKSLQRGSLDLGNLHAPIDQAGHNPT